MMKFMSHGYVKTNLEVKRTRKTTKSPKHRDEYNHKSRYENMFQPVDMDQIGESSSLATQLSNSNFHLPKQELEKFDGGIKNWLGFLGQFKKINDGGKSNDMDKFQYLVQATVPGSKAWELIERFPLSGINDLYDYI
jgi:hypothetical protein